MNFFKYLFFFFFITASLISSEIKFTQKQKEWIDKHKVIRFVIDNNWKPIEYVSKENGVYEGITSEYIKLVSKQTGIDFQIVPTTTWNESVEKINTREADLYSCVAQTSSREKNVDFSIKYIKIPQVFVTNQEISFISNIKSLYGKKIVLVRGYYISERIKKDHPQIEIIEVESITKAYQVLTRGEAYAYIDILPVASYYVQKEGYSNLKISGMSGYETDYSMALRNDWDKEGIEVINKALHSISEEDKSNIYNKWLYVKYDKGVDYTLLIEVVGILLLLIFASLFWNRKLSIEVKKRRIAQDGLEDSIKKIEKKNRRIEKILKISDIQSTELLDLNGKLEEATATAKNANKAKSDFLSNMSHEIRTPMNAILGFAELLDDSIEDKKLKSFTKTIRSSGQTLLFLINDILDLSKIEAGKLELIKSRVHVKNIFEETISIFKLQAEAKGVDLVLNIEQEIPVSLLIDSIRLKEILINLLGNALKFTDSGFIKVIAKVDEIYEHTSKIDLTIVVEDSGIGIEESQQNKIFNIFEQTENQDVRKYGGTGLGLAISRKLANLMGGSLEVESQFGEGASFILTLKNIDIASLSDEEIENSSHIDYNTIIFEKAVILIVDDIKENRDLVKESFHNREIKTLEAKNGQEAIDIVKSQDIDLIFMDIRMPIMDGYTATRHIKKFSNIPIVALTASIMQDELKKLEGEKFNGYLRKPVSRDELYAEVLKYLKYKIIQTQEIVEENILVEDKKALKEFFNALEPEITLLFKEAKLTNNISIITTFANSLLELSLKYNIKYMISYSELLLEKVDTFEVDYINNLLKDYKIKIEVLRESLN